MPKTPKKPEIEARYPKLTALWKAGDKALKFEEAKKYLGWREDTPEEKFTEWDIELPNGRRVVFENNRKNRPWNTMQLRTLKQEHLNRNWRMNPDGIGIGMFENIMSGQHRLRSFCEAEIERQSDPKKWGEEPLRMECVVVLGLDESDETFRILNTGAPATASDAFYRQGLFPKQTKAKQTKANRAKLCMMLESCIKVLWVRTGAAKDDQAPIPTNSEMVDFYERHPKTADCCVHIFESYSSGKGHSSRMGPGSAAAIMYLMWCSASDEAAVSKYRAKPSEKPLDWSMKDKAHDFWTELCNETPSNGFEHVREVLNQLCSDDEPLAGLYERKTVLARAWNLYRGDETITAAAVSPKDKDTHPDLGGIDMNESVGAQESEEGDPPVDADDVEREKSKIAEDKGGNGGVTNENKADKEREAVTRLRVEHRNKILLFRTKKELLMWEEDADLAVKINPKLDPKTFTNGMKYIGWPIKKADELLAKFKSMKKKAVFVIVGEDNQITTEDAE